MGTHYATHTFLGARRVSFRRTTFAIYRLGSKVKATLSAMIFVTIYYTVMLGKELNDHFSNRKYPRGLR